MGLLNRYDLEYAEAIAGDIAVRLELIADESSGLTEIPRFQVADKIGIQLEFLSRLPGTYQEQELILAVERQTDDRRFVLDTVLIENELSAPMAAYWAEYKLQVVMRSISRFADATGMELGLG